MNMGQSMFRKCGQTPVFYHAAGMSKTHITRPMGTCTKLPLLYESARLVVDSGRQRWNGKAGIVRSAAAIESHGWELVVSLRRITNVRMRPRNLLITTGQEAAHSPSVFADVQKSFELHFDSEEATRLFHDGVKRFMAETSNGGCKADNLYFKFDAFDLVKVRGVINIKIGSLGAADGYRAVNERLAAL